MSLLADAMISGEWLIALIGALASAAALILGKMQGKRDALRIESPVPEIPTRKVSHPPSWDAHIALSERVSKHDMVLSELRHEMMDVRKELGTQYRELLKSGHEREQSINDKLDGIARSIHARIDDFLKGTTTTTKP